MKKKTKVEYFIQMTNFLMGRCGLKKPVEIIQDNRLDCPCCVDDYNNKKKISVKYNAKELKKHPQCYILNFILHEIGHLKIVMPYSTDAEMILCERAAEKFSWKVMKKDYPTAYNSLLKIIKKNRTLHTLFNDKKAQMPYYWAYKKIKEYQLTTTKDDLKWLSKAEKNIENHE